MVAARSGLVAGVEKWVGCVCEVHSGGLGDRLDVAEEREGIYRNDASGLVTTAS